MTKLTSFVTLTITEGFKVEGIVYYDKPSRFPDERGFFQEVYNGPRMGQPLPRSMTQISHARSSRGVLRGMHWQQPNPVGKYVTCVSGRILDVVVDIRKSSPTFKQWRGYELNSDQGQSLWVPEGFAHGYVVISATADVLYAQSASFDPDCDRVLAWDDPEVHIDWPVMTSPFTISDKDKQAPKLSEIPEDSLFD